MQKIGFKETKEYTRKRKTTVAIPIGLSVNPSSPAPKPAVGAPGYSSVTTVDVAYLSLDPAMDATAPSPTNTLLKLKDEGYDHGYGKHEIPVIMTTGTASTRAGVGSPRDGVNKAPGPHPGGE